MEKRTLTCTLTPAESQQRGEELARATFDWEAVEEEKKSVTKLLGDKIKEHEGNMKRLARVLKSGKEEREIEVVWTPYPSNETMRLHRKDTWEELTSRPMSKEEKELYKQRPLPLPEPLGLPAAGPITPDAPPPVPIGLPPANYIAPEAPAPVLQLESNDIPEAEFEVQ